MTEKANVSSPKFNPLATISVAALAAGVVSLLNDEIA